MTRTSAGRPARRGPTRVTARVRPRPTPCDAIELTSAALGETGPAPKTEIGQTTKKTGPRTANGATAPDTHHRDAPAPTRATPRTRVGAMAVNGRRKSRRTPRGGLVAALDVGTTKTCCFIARVEDVDAIRITGIGHQVSDGIRAGAIVDMEAAAAAIGNAVHSAEEMAGETIREVVVNVTGGHPVSQTIDVEVPVVDHEVSDADLRRALSQGRTLADLGEGELIHAVPVGYGLDGTTGIRDPRGMFGERLEVALHLVTADQVPVRNLATCLARSHLEIETLVVSSYAAGLACLVEDEVDLGVTCIDIGGGTTSIAVFFDGCLVFTDMVAIGGNHITNDIARGLNTSITQAERLKSLYGNALVSPADEQDLIEVLQVGEDDRGQATPMPKSLLVGIIQPRLEELFEVVRARLDDSGFLKLAGRRVVLTGGVSQLAGIRDLAQVVLDKQVRLGRPTGMTGLGDASGPSFATVAGLVLHAVRQPDEIPTAGPAVAVPGGLWGRVGVWLREYL